MDELTNELPDSLLETEQTEQTNDPDAKIRELVEQKKHWREKALKESESRKQLEEKLAKLQPAEQPVRSGDLGAISDELVTIKLAQKGYDEDSVRFVKTYAKGLGKGALEVLEDETVKGFLDSQLARKRLSDAVPGPSSRTIAVEGKSFSEMTNAERGANWAKIVEQARKK